MEVQADLVEINVEITIENFCLSLFMRQNSEVLTFLDIKLLAEIFCYTDLLFLHTSSGQLVLFFTKILPRKTLNDTLIQFVAPWLLGIVCTNLFSRKRSFLTSVAGKNVSWFSIWGKHFFYVEQFCTLIQISHHNAVKKDDRPYELH